MSISSDVREMVRRAAHEPWVAENLFFLRRHDVDTYRHSHRVGVRSVQLGRMYSVEERTYPLLAASGLLHDIGKISIPVAYLRKNGTLTTDEQRIMDGHPLRGFMLLRTDERIPAEVLRAIVSHHKWQQRAYPETVPPPGSGTDIAQIVALADSYDGLTVDRAYRKAEPHDTAIETLRSQFTGDPRLIEVAAELRPLFRKG